MNLLPEENKQELTYEFWRRFVWFLGFYLIIIAVAADSLLLPSYFFLSFQLDKVKDRLNTTTNSVALQRTFSGEKQIKEARELINLSAGFVDKKAYISPLIEDVLGRTTASTSLSSFQYQIAPGGKGALRMSGVAGSRDELLLYVANLKKSSYIINVDSPVSNYLDEKGGVFNVTVDLAP